MRSILSCLATVTLATVLSGCGGEPAAPDSDALRGKLTLTGSSTVAPLAGEIAKRFESMHPGVRVDVQTGGSSRGIADAKRGTADIGMASRALGPEETDLTAHTIAADGIALIVHEENPIQGLTDAHVVDIFTGRIDNWSDAGGQDAPVTVVNKAEGRATLEVFLEHFELTSDAIDADVIVGHNQQGIRTVANDPNAIGYVSIGAGDAEASSGVPIRLLPLDGVEPTIANVRSGLFPMSRPLNLVTHGEISDLARAFIEFAQSPQVNDLVESLHFVPISE